MLSRRSVLRSCFPDYSLRSPFSPAPTHQPALFVHFRLFGGITDAIVTTESPGLPLVWPHTRSHTPAPKIPHIIQTRVRTPSIDDGFLSTGMSAVVACVRGALCNRYQTWSLYQVDGGLVVPHTYIVGRFKNVITPCMTPAGLEPAIPGSVGRCLIHWATGPPTTPLS